MRARLGTLTALAIVAALGCKSKTADKGDAAAAPSATVSAKATPVASSASAVATDVNAAEWVPQLEGLANREGVKFGLAACFTETKHCVQFPLGWRNDGRATAMGDGKIAWGYPSNRHVCLAVDRGGSDWAELIQRDEAEQKGFSAPVDFKLGPDEIPSTLRVKRLDMASTRPYPYNMLMWFGCFGVDPVAAANPSGMPTGKATLLVIKAAVKAGLTFNAYGYLADAATAEEKRDLLATLRGLRALPGRLATHPK